MLFIVVAKHNRAEMLNSNKIKSKTASRPLKQYQTPPPHLISSPSSETPTPLSRRREWRGGRPAFGTVEELPHKHTYIRYGDEDEYDYKKGLEPRTRSTFCSPLSLSRNKKVDWCRLAGLGWMVHGRDGLGVAISSSLVRE